MKPSKTDAFDVFMMVLFTCLSILVVCGTVLAVQSTILTLLGAK